MAKGSTGHVLALSTLSFFQKLMVRNNHSGARLRGTFQRKRMVSDTNLKAVHLE